MAASKPSSSFTQAHLRGPPAMPTALAPAILASCPTNDPTGPPGAATTTVSPLGGFPIIRTPQYAVDPRLPSTPTRLVTGRPRSSIVATRPIAPLRLSPPTL